jgi:exopolysaccharide biosynthesis polyprenyl glycosylphosphotransferase
MLPMSLASVFYSLCFYLCDLYEDHFHFKSFFFLSRFVVALAIGFSVMAVISYLVPVLKIGRGLAVLNLAYALFFVSLWRMIFEYVFLSNLTRNRVLIVGAGHAGRHIMDVIKQNHNLELIGFVDDDANKHNTVVHGTKVIGGSELLPVLARKNIWDIVVVAVTHERSTKLLKHLFLAKLSGVAILDVPTLYEAATGKIPVSHLRTDWIVFTSFNAMTHHIYGTFKRFLDVFFSFLAILVAAPVILFIMILVKLDSRGPVFYVQKRIGKDGREFAIYKFRSMIVGADKKTGGLYTAKNDNRITRVGNLIRAIRLDELPQLWNILIGDMSFVGPRPEAVELSKRYEMSIPNYSLRHVIRPGLTGWAQVRWRYGISEEDALEKFKYDLYHIKNISFLLDLQIFLKTLSVVLFPRQQ